MRAKRRDGAGPEREKQTYKNDAHIALIVISHSVHCNRSWLCVINALTEHVKF